METKDAIKKMNIINSHYDIYTIFFDNRLGVGNPMGDLGSKHHLIPAGFEKIPNLTFFLDYKMV